MSVGTNIKKRRFELRMSQQELADALGYKTRSTIAKIESGENDINQKKLQRFAEALDTTVDALITGVSAQQVAAASRSYLIGVENAINIRSEDRRPKTVAVILAGGKSGRNRQNIPNQFINILGKPAIVYCLEAYQAHPAVDDIYVVCLKGWEQIVTAYAQQYGITKLRSLIPAAPSGILSVRNGVEYVKAICRDDDIVIFQESTRPLISADMISKLLQSCYENGSATVCSKMKDHVQFIYVNGKARYIDRDSVVSLESPEAYRLGIIKSVFLDSEKKQHPLNESCCSMLLFNLGYDINFIEGSINNIKIVRQEDIAIITSLLSRTVGD